MSRSKEVHNRALNYDVQFDYLPDADRYLLARSKPEFKLNVIGTGINGQEHIRVTHLEGRATVHGIFDPNPRSVEGAKRTHAQFQPDTPLVIYDSLEAACCDPDVDALVISTPNYTHLDVLRVAVESGKHLLIEKPLATNVQDAAAITHMADTYPAIFQVGLQYRYKAMYAEAIYEALHRQTVGGIQMIHIQEARIPFLDKVNQWNKFAKFSGNTLVEKCCHYFDLMNLFAQARPRNVYASGGTAINFKEFEYNGEKSDVLDNAMVIVNYENGIRANFNLCMFAPMFYEELVIAGTEGRLQAWERQDFNANSAWESEMAITCAEGKPSRHTRLHYPAWIEQSGHNGATYYEHVNFINRMKGESSNAASALEGLWSVVVASAAQESIRTGQVITINDFLAASGVQL
ncbi:MAG: Gfo/Idh/MocA family protein [Phototrophicaceae bacterium]